MSKIIIKFKNGDIREVPNLRDCGMESDVERKTIKREDEIEMIVITDEWRNQYCYSLGEGIEEIIVEG